MRIGSKEIGKKYPCLISLEPGATYSNFEDAKKMIQMAAVAGADAIKFQTFLPGDADRIMGEKSIEIEYGTATGKKKELVYDALKRRELTKVQWKELVDYTKSQKLLFITAPYFTETVDFLQEIKVDAIKVSKGDVNNVILIEKIAQTGLPIILDTREKLTEIDKDIQICKENNNENIILMHCPSGYPAENVGVHLNAIKFLKEKYSYPIGFADHSPGDIMNYAAVVLGANILEKTITLNKSTEAVEHFMSLEPTELKTFVQNIRMLEEAAGNEKILEQSRVEESVRRSIVAKRDLEKGEIITRDMLDFRRPGNVGISCEDGFEVLGKKTKVNIDRNSFIKWDMIE